MASLIKLQKMFSPRTLDFPFPDDIPYTLHEYDHCAIILFEPKIPMAFYGKPPAILLTSLAGVKTVEDVLAYLKLAGDSDLNQLLANNQRLKQEGKVLRTEQYSLGYLSAAITIDSSALGVVPGNSSTFLLMRTAPSCIYVRPTFHLRFDWSQLKLRLPGE